MARCVVSEAGWSLFCAAIRDKKLSVATDALEVYFRARGCLKAGGGICRGVFPVTLVNDSCLVLTGREIV